MANLQSPDYQETYHDHKRVHVLFVSTGAERLQTMMELLAGEPYKRKHKWEQFEKPNRPPYGGLGWFRFCLENDYQLSDPKTILAPIWRTIKHRDRQLSLI